MEMSVAGWIFMIAVVAVTLWFVGGMISDQLFFRRMKNRRNEIRKIADHNEAIRELEKMEDEYRDRFDFYDSV